MPVAKAGHVFAPLHYVFFFVENPSLGVCVGRDIPSQVNEYWLGVKRDGREFRDGPPLCRVEEVCPSADVLSKVA